MYYINDVFGNEIYASRRYFIIDLPSLNVVFKQGSELMSLPISSLNEYPQLYYIERNKTIGINGLSFKDVLDRYYLDILQIASSEDKKDVSVVWLGKDSWKCNLEIDTVSGLKINGSKQVDYYSFGNLIGFHVFAVHRVNSQIYKISVSLTDMTENFPFCYVYIFLTKDEIIYVSLSSIEDEYKCHILNYWKSDILDAERVKLMYALGERLGRELTY